MQLLMNVYKMASIRWTIYAVLASVLFITNVTCYLQLDLHKLDQFVEKTRGLIGRMACLDENSELCLLCPNCVDYVMYGTVDDPAVINEWLDVLNFTMAETSHFAALASWNYVTNITKYNTEFLSNVSMLSGNYGLEMKDEARRIIQDKLDGRSKRMLKFALRGSELRDGRKRRLLQMTTNKMQTIYSVGKVCPSDQPAGKTEGCLALEPDLENILAKNRDYDELLRVWVGWRDAVGPKIGKLYPTYVELKNEAANSGGYDTYTDVLLEKYEDPTFEEEVDELWQEVKPMYLQLHSYVRRKLAGKYGDDKVDVRAPIPAHLLGNMWAQQWNNIYDIVEPFPNKGTIDVTDKMKEEGWTVLKMFQVANRFFKSLGLYEMPPTFWTKSMFEKPKDREVVCHGSAHDFAEYRDVRIKMCTEVNMEDLNTVHHEMGHCEYYLQYNKQPEILRGGANPGFHEAVGDTIALSVVTPDYLNQIGLLDSNKIDKSQEINYLMEVALNKIAFLPFGLLIDKWRWQVFRGEITPEEYNDKWWQLREEYQGLVPPVKRTTSDFDPGAKYHIPSGTPYIRYFVSFLIQFQFHEALCKAANNQGPLHLCNVYNSKEAGTKLKSMLEMGMSRPWPDAMEVLTGAPNMDTSAIKEYFRPLMEWLEKENDGQLIGWGNELRIFRRQRK
ncbi:angiotensin-converting enzyme-like [Lytechinus pictus]|uniref:angiotensin-converting enzyme-like n=1 Tax=Lytechinus pictus TaxID=7653 RepID=UPI0030BA2990